MYAHPGVKTDKSHPVPDRMKAWVLGDPDQLTLTEKPVPVPGRAEVLVRIDAVSICTTDGGFAEYAVNNINTLIHIPDAMSDEEATLVVTAGTAMYGLSELGGLVAGESVVVTGPGPIGLLGVAVAKALGASPVILTGTRDNRLAIGLELGADYAVNVRREDAVEAVRRLNGGRGV